jgi:hypothetical protein
MIILDYVGFIYVNSKMKLLRYFGSKKHEWKIKKGCKM